MTRLLRLRRNLRAKMVPRSHGILGLLLRPTPAWITSSATSSPPRTSWRTTQGGPLPHPLCVGGADPPANSAEADRSHRAGGSGRPRGQPGEKNARGEDVRKTVDPDRRPSGMAAAHSAEVISQYWERHLRRRRRRGLRPQRREEDVSDPLSQRMSL